MSHFATTEDNHYLDAVSVIKEAFNFADFNVKVVVRDFEADFHCLKLRLFFASFFTVFCLLLHLLVLVFTPVDDFDNGRVGVSRDFDEVNSLISGEKLGISATHDTELLPICSNYTYLFIADFSVNSSMRKFVCYGGPFS